MFPLASLAHTWALTDSASLTGWPGGTITTRVGVQPSGISASKEIVAEAIVFLSVFKGLVLLIDDLVDDRLGHPLCDACGYRVHA
jgi:hypothetical protein